MLFKRQLSQSILGPGSHKHLSLGDLIQLKIYSYFTFFIPQSVYLNDGAMSGRKVISSSLDSWAMDQYKNKPILFNGKRKLIKKGKYIKGKQKIKLLDKRTHPAPWKFDTTLQKGEFSPFRVSYHNDIVIFILST